MDTDERRLIGEVFTRSHEVKKGDLIVKTFAPSRLRVRYLFSVTSSSLCAFAYVPPAISAALRLW